MGACIPSKHCITLHADPGIRIYEIKKVTSSPKFPLILEFDGEFREEDRITCIVCALLEFVCFSTRLLFSRLENKQKRRELPGMQIARTEVKAA